jgi:hypothetical protein
MFSQTKEGQAMRAIAGAIIINAGAIYASGPRSADVGGALMALVGALIMFGLIRFPQDATPKP